MNYTSQCGLMYVHDTDVLRGESAAHPVFYYGYSQLQMHSNYLEFCREINFRGFFLDISVSDATGRFGNGLFG